MQRTGLRERYLKPLVSVAMSAILVFSGAMPPGIAFAQTQGRPSSNASLSSHQDTSTSTMLVQDSSLWTEPQLALNEQGEGFEEAAQAELALGMSIEEAQAQAQQGEVAAQAYIQNELLPQTLANTPSAQAAEDHDISSKVHVDAKIWINGKEYTGGDVSAHVGNNFSYRFIWDLKDAGIGYLHPEDHFAFTVFSVPGLNLSNKNKALSQQIVD